MKTGKLVLSTLAYVVIVTGFAFIWHENMFGDYYRGFNIYSNIENINIAVATAGSLIEGLVLSYLFQRFAPATGRLRFGIILGVLLCLFGSSYGVFQTAALENVQGAGIGTFIALEFAAMMVYGVIGGALAALIIKQA